MNTIKRIMILVVALLGGVVAYGQTLTFPTMDGHQLEKAMTSKQEQAYVLMFKMDNCKHCSAAMQKGELLDLVNRHYGSDSSVKTYVLSPFVPTKDTPNVKKLLQVLNLDFEKRQGFPIFVVLVIHNGQAKVRKITTGYNPAEKETYKNNIITFIDSIHQ